MRPLNEKKRYTVNWNGHVEPPNFDDFSLPMEDLPWFNIEENIERIKEIVM